ncbi:hypothetical protein SOPP22_03875 [Shewanella sp. OPT22]|nr:hypothetical protein SOPP22_03875 [Shewanella sp. OPT22]
MRPRHKTLKNQIHSSVELTQKYRRFAIAITLVARILPQLAVYRHEKYGLILWQNCELSASVKHLNY